VKKGNGTGIDPENRQRRSPMTGTNETCFLGASSSDHNIKTKYIYKFFFDSCKRN